MLSDKELITEVLKQEVVPSIGCTEPTAIGVGVALAFNASIGNLDETLKRRSKTAAENAVKAVKKIFVRTDRNTFKNSMNAGIPRADGTGLRTAVAMAFLGDPSLGLRFFDSVDTTALPLVGELDNKVEIEVENIGIEKPNLVIDVTVETTKGEGHAVIKHRHTNVVLIEANNRVLYKQDEKPVKHEFSDSRQKRFRDLMIDELVDYVQEMPVSAERIVNEGIRVNTELSNAGLEKEIGIGTGYLLHKSSVGSDDLATYIKARTAAAADCRMFGLLLPAMSVTGSGNHGIMATMPIVGYAEKRGINKDLLIEAVTLSYLITVYATYHSSFLSAACGCATKAGTGAASGLAYYMCNRDSSCCKRSIQNFIANTPGMLCDGAKYGCSLKLATAADAALQSALLAFYHKEVPYTNGILGKSAEESIRNMGEVIENTMSLDRTILRIMSRKSSKKPLYSSFTR